MKYNIDAKSTSYGNCAAKMVEKQSDVHLNLES